MRRQRAPNYRNRADTICRDLNRRVRLLGDELNPLAATKHNLRVFALYLDRFVPIFRSHTRQLRTLPEPSDDRRLLHQVLDGLEQEVRDDEAARQAANKRHLAAFYAAARHGQAVVPHLQRVASRFGFTVCGRIA